jgi:putative tricarboxylic transport membrane protein
MDLWISGVSQIFSFYPLAAIVVGVAIGIIFGSIPGMSATMAIALCLPMTFGLDPVISLSLLVALFVGGISGGLITAILINIPGTPSSIATTFDGYPMTQAGNAGKALGVGILFSFLGSILGCLVLFFLAPSLAKFALRFGTYEYFAISVFALTLVAGLSGKNLAKGIASAALGLLIAMVGVAPIDGYKRFTMEVSQFDAGIALLPVLLGLFAVSEVLKESENAFLKHRTKFPSFEMPKFFGISMQEFMAQIVNLFRSSAIGIGIGLLPGIGSGTSNLLAYLAAKNSSKTPEKFGTGVVDGLVASESSNNAGIGAAMIPLITLGIPGDSVTAMLLGGFLIHGIQPGPMLFQSNGSLVYAIFVALLVANVVMLLLEYFGIRLFIKVLAIPKHYLLSIVMVMAVIGSFAINNRMFDVYTLIAFGAFGYAMIKFDYPFPPLILGFILGPMIEQNMRSALMSTRGSFLPFFERPVSALFLSLAALYILVIIWRTASSKKQALKD